MAGADTQTDTSQGSGQLIGGDKTSIDFQDISLLGQLQMGPLKAIVCEERSEKDAE